jgi:hypothetical protein
MSTWAMRFVRRGLASFSVPADSGRDSRVGRYLALR